MKGKIFLLRFVETEAGEVIYNCFYIYIYQAAVHTVSYCNKFVSVRRIQRGLHIVWKYIKIRLSHSGKFSLDHK